MIAHIADVWTKTLNKKGEQKLKKEQVDALVVERARSVSVTQRST